MKKFIIGFGYFTVTILLIVLLSACFGLYIESLHLTYGAILSFFGGYLIGTTITGSALYAWFSKIEPKLK